MMKLKLFALAMALMGFGAAVFPPASVFAAELNSQVDCTGIEGSEFCSAKDNEANSLFGPEGVATKVITALNVLVGIAAVIMIIVGGLRYITSSGDPAKLNSAKNTIIYACIGVAIAAMSQVIVAFVVNAV
jgi:hypothetical protein